MRHAVSSDLYAYWRALGKGGRPPERSDVEPGAIRGVLAETFVLDFDPASGFPFRISGSKIDAVFLKQLRGAPFLSVWREADRGWVARVLHDAAERETPCLLIGEARPAGRAPAEIEVALLPLRHNGATHARMLGSLSAGAGSDWLGLIGAGPMAVKALRSLGSEGREERRATVRVLPSRRRLEGAA